MMEIWPINMEATHRLSVKHAKKKTEVWIIQLPKKTKNIKKPSKQALNRRTSIIMIHDRWSKVVKPL